MKQKHFFSILDFFNKNWCLTFLRPSVANFLGIRTLSSPVYTPGVLQILLVSAWHWVSIELFVPDTCFFYDINFHLFVNQSPFRHQLIDPMDCWESPVKKRQNDNFRLFRPNRAPGLIGLKTVSNRNSPLDWLSNDGFTAERWEWMKNDKPERSVNRPICHQSVNPTFSVRVWKTPIRSGNLKGRGWKLTKTPSRLKNGLKKAKKRIFFIKLELLKNNFWPSFLINFGSIEAHNYQLDSFPDSRTQTPGTFPTSAG